MREDKQGATAQLRRATRRRPALPLSQQPVWCTAAWVLLASLVVWSYGANNVPFPVSLGARVPLADVVLVVLLVRSRRWWVPWTRTWPGSSMLLLLTLLGVFSVGRAVIDAPEHGAQAFRGGLFALEAWAVMVGVALVRRLGPAAVARMYSIIFGAAIAWFMLYPLRETLLRVSPTVGVQRPTELFSFVSMGLVASWAVFWFGGRRSLLSLIALVGSVLALLFVQARGVYVGVLVALLAVGLAARGTGDSRLVRRLVVGAAAGLIILSVLPPLPGRLGVVSFDTMVGTARTAIGREADVPSSFNDRRLWIGATVDTVRAAEFGWLFGVGFGEDLTGGFRTDRAAVVKPHNDFLEFYARLGVFVLPWMLLWVVALREFWAGARSGDQLAAWGLAGAIVMIFLSLTQPVNSFAYGGLVWWMLAGGILGTERGVPGTAQDRPAASSREIR